MSDQAASVIRLPQVSQRTGLSRSTLYRFIGEGRFPQPLKLGRHASGWLASEVETWIVTRAQSRGDAAAVRPQEARL